MRAEEKLIVRESFAMFFGGGEIFFIQLDGLGDHRVLVTEKFGRDMETLLKPSAPSRIALHIKETAVDWEMLRHMLRAMGAPGQHMQKVAVVGLSWRGRRLWKRLSRSMETPPQYASALFDDLEQAKLWLME